MPALKPKGTPDRPDRPGEKGMTYVELLVSMAVLALIVGLTAQIVAGALDTWRYGTGSNGPGTGKARLLHTAQLAMERMVKSVRETTWVLIPSRLSDPSDVNPANPDDPIDPFDPNDPNRRFFPRTILAVSGNIDNDNDGFVDEDPSADNTCDDAPGILGVDDDDDGLVDLADTLNTHDDDEDGGSEEDKPDGQDSDLDGRYDEDPNARWSTPYSDVDGDGLQSEDCLDPLIFEWSGSTLTERQNILTTEGTPMVIAENVTLFQVLRRRVNGKVLVEITLRLGSGSNAVELKTAALARAKIW